MKRQKAFNYFYLVGAEIVFPRETHFSSSYKPNYIHIHYPTFFLANAPDKTRGVAICVTKSLAFSPSQVITDPEKDFMYWLRGTLKAL